MNKKIFKNVLARKARVDLHGELFHEELDSNELEFSDNTIIFGDLIIPFHEIEEAKLNIDRLYYRSWIGIHVLVDDTQYTFGFRGKYSELQEIQLDFEVTENRRTWTNLLFVYISFCLSIIIFLILSYLFSS